MHIRITGGSGFVGAHLAARLKAEGIGFAVLTRNSASRSETSIPCDYSSKDSLRSGLAGADALVNLVGRFEPPFAEQLQVNAAFAHILSEAAAEARVRRVIHVSAAAVYGDAMLNKPASEETVPMPTTTYALTKLLGEQIWSYAARTYGMTAVMLRPTNIYGPGAHAGVVHSLLTSLKTNGSMRITGDGTQLRDLIHVSDVADAILATLSAEEPKAVYNISSSDVYSLNTLAEVIRSNWQGKVDIQKDPEAPGFVRNLVADSSLLTRDTGWKAKRRFVESLPELLNSI